MTNSVVVFEHPLVIENSRNIRQMTCGDQHAIKTKPATTSMLARRLLLRNVDVCGMGSSAGGQVCC
jgi:hypothetical protein